MSGKLFILCLIPILELFAYKGESFAENHYRFITNHLPKLLNNESGKILLIGSFGPTYSKLSKQYPLIEFAEVCVWHGNSWDETIGKQNFYGPFDCIVAMHVLERQQDRENVLRVISKLLIPGGKILMYIDPQEDDSLDQRIERYVRQSKWHKRIPIIPSLSILGYNEIINDAGFHIVEQSPAQYQIYYPCDLSAFFSLSHFVCSRWPVPRTDWDEELFSSEIKNHLNHRWEIIDVPYSTPNFKSWIEDTLSTYYFIIKKQHR